MTRHSDTRSYQGSKGECEDVPQQQAHLVHVQLTRFSGLDVAPCL